VTLLANDQACCLPVCRDPECPECLKITFVGCTPSDRIGTTAGPPDLRGYGYADLSYDRPFYGSLQITGWRRERRRLLQGPGFTQWRRLE
jgi:hypothetical protein